MQMFPQPKTAHFAHLSFQSVEHHQKGDLKDPPAGVRKLISEIRVDSLVSAMKSAKTNMDNICL